MPAPFLITSVVLAAIYGASFLLPDYLLGMKLTSTTAGSIISTFILATIVCANTAGRIAQRFGMLQIKYLTLLSSSQMAALGLAAPIGHPMAQLTGSFSVVYVGIAISCFIASAC